ncbi:MAG: putative cytokinetic ring protein SteA [Actinomycetota bacterium]|nr:putative cytokinetic ring protein SteA [Actinomycetota bacterium]
MKLRRRRAARARSASKGVARVGDRTKDLVKRLERGEIAVIDHRDIDRVAADGLVAAGVAAVVNASPSISGRYPNGGPIRIVEAGIPLLDDVGSDVMDLVRDGEVLELRDGALWRDGEKIAAGVQLDADEITARMDDARNSIGSELEAFARNTLEYVDKEAELTFATLDLPPLHTKIRGRHALVVVRGHDYRHDLRALRPYIKEYQPVCIAVDGGADALLEVGAKPDIIVGDFDSLSDRALHCGAELVAHERGDGYSPASELLESQGLPFHRIVAPGMSEDVAMLLAYEAGATLIVAVGTHATMVEFLDKGRRGMASTFLTRLRLGPVLVDAKGVSRLYEGRVRRRDMVLLVAAAVAAMVAMTFASDSLRVFIDGMRLDIGDWLNGPF